MLGGPARTRTSAQTYGSWAGIQGYCRALGGRAPSLSPGSGRGRWVDEKDIQGSPHSVPRAPLLSARGHTRGSLAKMTGRLSGLGATQVSLVRENPHPGHALPPTSAFKL